jgi:hypothetical protein
MLGGTNPACGPGTDITRSAVMQTHPEVLQQLSADRQRERLGQAAQARLVKTSVESVTPRRRRVRLWRVERPVAPALRPTPTR